MRAALFVAGLLVLTSGASTAFAGACEDYCLHKRCAPGNVDFNRSICMSKCVQACNLRHAETR